VITLRDRLNYLLARPAFWMVALPLASFALAAVYEYRITHPWS
jgi:hypothetical protein